MPSLQRFSLGLPIVLFALLLVTCANASAEDNNTTLQPSVCFCDYEKNGEKGKDRPVAKSSLISTYRKLLNVKKPPQQRLSTNNRPTKTSEVIEPSCSCQRRFRLDLGREFTTSEDFQRVKELLYYGAKACFDVGKADGMRLNYLLADEDNTNEHAASKQHTEGGQRCASDHGCLKMIHQLDNTSYIQPYNSSEMLWSSNVSYNSWYITHLIMKLKLCLPECKFNSLIVITNRVIDMKTVTNSFPEFLQQEQSYFCTRLSIIVVGRDYNRTRQLTIDNYGGFSDIYPVGDYNCLGRLINCLVPCVAKANAAECDALELSNCSNDTLPLLPALPPGYSESEEDENTTTRHILYLFALTAHVTESQFARIKAGVRIPIEAHYKKGKKLSVALLFPAPVSEDMSWVHNVGMLHSEMDEIRYGKSVIRGGVRSGEANNNDEHTTDLFKAAMHKYHEFDPNFENENQNVEKNLPRPKIVLITDYIAKHFIANILERNSNSTTPNYMTHFDLKIYTTHTNIVNFYLTARLIGRADITRIDLTGQETLLIPVDDTRPVGEWYPTRSTEETIFIIVIGGASVCLLVLVICTIFYRQKLLWLKRLERFRSSHNSGKETGGGGTASTGLTGELSGADAEGVLRAGHTDFWETSWDRLVIKSEKLGSGAYGQVFRGTLMGRPPCYERVYQNRPTTLFAGGMENCEVAVKMLPRYASEQARKEFMFEIELMKSLGFNENIVGMLGCITVGPSLCLVLEYCPNRDLLTYVRALRDDLGAADGMEEKLEFAKDHLFFAWQISDGMRFLGLKGVVHRDLAARNILVDADKNAKIGDFGLCISSATGEKAVSAKGKKKNSTFAMNEAKFSSDMPKISRVSVSGRLPIKWLAIECLRDRVFSPKSDIWSFAILLFELYTFGDVPFEDVEPETLLDHLTTGNRLSQPPLCPDDLYQIMQRCWLEEPDQRPSFQELLTLFTVLLERATEGYGYLTLLKTTNEHYEKLGKLALVKSFREEIARSRASSAEQAALNAARGLAPVPLKRHLSEQPPRRKECEEKSENLAVPADSRREAGEEEKQEAIAAVNTSR